MAGTVSWTTYTADPAAKATKIRTTITPLEGGWARIETFSGKGYGQTVSW